MNKQTKNNKLKIFLISILVLIIVGFGGYALYAYENTAPQRVVASFINDLALKGNAQAAYAQTTPEYKLLINYNNFVADFKPLTNSGTKYSIIGSKTVEKQQVLAGGVIYDLNGANFYYLMHLSQINGRWFIASVIINKQ